MVEDFLAALDIRGVKTQEISRKQNIFVGMVIREPLKTLRIVLMGVDVV
jgi:hypothetical protein